MESLDEGVNEGDEGVYDRYYIYDEHYMYDLVKQCRVP